MELTVEKLRAENGRLREALENLLDNATFDTGAHSYGQHGHDDATAAVIQRARDILAQTGPEKPVYGWWASVDQHGKVEGGAPSSGEWLLSEIPVGVIGGPYRATAYSLVSPDDALEKAHAYVIHKQNTVKHGETE